MAELSDIPDFVFRATLPKSVLQQKYGISERELRGPLWRRSMHG